MNGTAPAKPRMFIGSSVEGLAIAYAIQENLDHEAEITVWPQGVFELSAAALDSLLRVLQAADFGVFVFTPDDVLRIRGSTYPAVRDNVIFELGLFLGQLGRQRTFLVTPRSEPQLHIPSDLAGLTPATYEPNRSDKNLQAALGAACNQLRRTIQQLGPIQATTNLLTPSDPREAVLRGMQLATHYVAQAMGPQGRGMAVTLKGGQQVVTRTGSLIASGVKARGLEVLGVKEVREVTQEMDDAVGDGAKIASLLMTAMAERGHKALTEGHLPRDLVEGMRRAVEDVKAALRAQAVPAASKEDVRRIASTAAQSPELADLVVNAMEYVGRDGIITVQEMAGASSRLERLEGVQFERGYISANFALGSPDNKINLEDCYVLVTAERVDTIRSLLGILEAVAATKRPLLVVADEIEGEALATLVVNAQRGVVRSAAVKAPGHGVRRRSQLEDLAILTGATLIAHDLGLSVEGATLSDLGRAKRVIVDKDTTTLVEGAGDPAGIEARAASIRSEIDGTGSDFEREQLQQRLARLRGGVANILVGGVTYSDAFEARYWLESALHSAYQGVATGFVAGGGKALVNAAAGVRAIPPRGDADAAGLAVVLAALDSPLRSLIATTKRDLESTLAEIAQGGPGVGINAETAQVEDLTTSGVIDPEGTISRAIDLAFAHARRFLLTESWESTPSGEATGPQSPAE